MRPHSTTRFSLLSLNTFPPFGRCKHLKLSIFFLATHESFLCFHSNFETDKNGCNEIFCWNWLKFAIIRREFSFFNICSTIFVHFRTEWFKNFNWIKQFLFQLYTFKFFLSRLTIYLNFECKVYFSLVIITLRYACTFIYRGKKMSTYVGISLENALVITIKNVLRMQMKLGVWVLSV